LKQASNEVRELKTILYRGTPCRCLPLGWPHVEVQQVEDSLEKGAEVIDAGLVASLTKFQQGSKCTWIGWLHPLPTSFVTASIRRFANATTVNENKQKQKQTKQVHDEGRSFDVEVLPETACQCCHFSRNIIPTVPFHLVIRRELLTESNQN
jgi:hypothetical protein